MLQSKDQMAEQLKSGTSIKLLRLSEVDTKTILFTFKAMEDQTMLLWQVPTLDGGNFSNLTENTLSILRTRKLLMLREEKMLKDKPFGPGEDTMVLTRDGLFFTLLIEKLIERRE